MESWLAAVTDRTDAYECRHGLGYTIYKGIKMNWKPV